MKKSGLLCLLVVLAFLREPPKAFGSVLGGFGSGNPCGSSGTLYTNLTNLPINFELTASTTNNPFGSCTNTISWTDENGHAQSLTVPNAVSITVSSSLKGNSSLTWNSSGSATLNAGGTWQLERAPAQSVTGYIFGSGEDLEPPCGSSGTLYSNLRSTAVTLDLAVSNSSPCALTVSWTDASGHAQTLDFGTGGSEGASTSLPAGGAISWTSATATGYVVAQWQIERVVTSKLW
jgi:hypothetical protein